MFSILSEDCRAPLRFARNDRLLQPHFLFLNSCYLLLATCFRLVPPLKVVIISFHFGEYCVRLANALAEHAAVHLFLPEGAATSPALDERVSLHSFEKPRLRQVGAQLSLIFGLAREVRFLRPDVVHLQQGHLWFNLVLRFLRLPLIITVHDPTHHLNDKSSQKTPQWIVHDGFRVADVLIVHAETLRRETLALPGLAQKQVAVVPHMTIGAATACAASPEAEAGTVLFFGRIWEYKGLDYLIRAAPEIRAHCPNLNIIIAGRGEDFAKYEAMMAQPETFEIHNQFIPEAEVETLFRRASVVVAPYVEATQSGVVHMAYAYAKPVVATHVGGLPEVVEDEVTGLLVPPRDEAVLAAAIVKLLSDEALRVRLGKAAKLRAETTYSAATVAAQTLQVYESVLTKVETPK